MSGTFDEEYNIIEEHRAKYLAAMRSMQSGVAMWMNYDPGETQPKHLRVGVNSAFVQSSVLADILIKKGIITEEEWWGALVDGMEAEANDYAKKIEARLGGSAKIHLR